MLTILTPLPLVGGKCRNRHLKKVGTGNRKSTSLSLVGVCGCPALVRYSVAKVFGLQSPSRLAPPPCPHKYHQFPPSVIRGHFPFLSYYTLTFPSLDTGVLVPAFARVRLVFRQWIPPSSSLRVGASTASKYNNQYLKKALIILAHFSAIRCVRLAAALASGRSVQNHYNLVRCSS